MNSQEQEIFNQALDTLNRVHRQCDRLLRSTISLKDDPGLMTYNNVRFELRILQQMLKEVKFT